MKNPMDPQSKPRVWRSGALAAVLLAGTALGGFAVGNTGLAQTDATAVNPPGATVTQHVLPDFSDLVTQVKPAVVSITTKLKVTDAADVGPGQLPFPFNQPPFNQMIPHGHGQGGPGQAIEARGSGFIVDANGTVVTNNHVVKDAKSVSVTLDDGTVLTAKVIGADPRTDIAVLKIDAHRKLPFIQLGNSANVKPGQWVVAMGNPFGLGGTVTAGIVSASGRDIGEGPYDQFIQVDAPINQGNSGGPLFTQDGKVIGMNTAIFSPSGGSVGIGFAIPSDMIRTVITQLEKDGHVTRGYIGVEAQQINPTTAQALHLTDQSGALLAGVQPDSPAQRAGLQPGDVIRSLNGEAVKNPRDLAVHVAGVQPGETAKLEVVRDGQSKTVEVKVGELPGDQTASLNGGQQHGDHHARLGIGLAALTPDIRDQLNLPEGVRGAVVSEVQPGSPADQAGLQQGDVIVGVGTEAVHSPADAAKALRAAENGSDHALALRILRNGEPAFVGLNLAPQDQEQG